MREEFNLPSPQPQAVMDDDIITKPGQIKTKTSQDPPGFLLGSSPEGLGVRSLTADVK